MNACSRLENACLNHGNILITKQILKELNIPELWKLKTIGKIDPSHTLPTEEEFPRDIFIKEIGRNCQGHYILGLPWQMRDSFE